ncbi:hypothetical protein CTZ28_19885 [Streptomyces shenzhenensis]|uniref:Uncharacterized protein n=1 Tax=Streptomyces shenzhenensis TaxID=943815 RepID=A0A3M0I778_9ACTN|nr:hypothetical protein CTZ28_19885 [Streptomyces shenzhenensis]
MTASPGAVAVGESLVGLVRRTGTDAIRPLPGDGPATVAIGPRRLGNVRPPRPRAAARTAHCPPVTRTRWY